MPNLSTVLLSIKGEAKKASISLTSDSEITIELLQKYFKKKDAPEIVHRFQIDNKFVFVFGYLKGKKGTENKSTLPQLKTALALFGDAIIIVSNQAEWSHPVPFTVEQWINMNKLPVKQTKKEEKEDQEEDDQEEEEEEEEEEIDELSEIEEEEAEDDFDGSDSEAESIIEKEEELEEAPVPVKRRRAPVIKVDITAVKEEIDIQSPPESHKIRMACLHNFEFLTSSFSEEQIRSLEKSIFEASSQFAQKNYVVRSWKSTQFIDIYKQIFRSVVNNIHPDSPVKNPRLLLRILEGEFELSAIPFMTSYEMYPEKWFELKDRLVQREQKILEGNKSRATDQFKCRRCNKRECTYYELQTRSADEPMTIFITCLNCGKEWRQG
jgi:DNA-directed RNA polymerase subunit M/transcription elongation factor TFIIS